MKLPKFLNSNLILKITSVNSTVIVIRLVIALFVQRILAEMVGQPGIAKVGKLRNVLAMLSSISTLGVSSGIIKYIAEYKSDESSLNKLFSGVFILGSIGTILSSALLFLFSETISVYLFGNPSFEVIILLLAALVPFVAMHRIFNSVISGLSDYKSYAKADLFAYVIGVVLLLTGLYFKNLKGALFGIALIPLVQWTMLLLVFGKILKSYLKFKELNWSTDFVRLLLVFSLMSFVSTFLINTVELDIITQIENRISENDAGNWTAMVNISKNYMAFATGLYSLYVLPRFSTIKTEIEFKKELVHIYKSILPFFGLGMILVYLFREFIIALVYPDFVGMESLFKWQLMGDFVKLCSVVMAHQFLAKKLVRNFIFSELLSLALFYLLTKIFITSYGVEGVVLAHLVRYVIYFVVVAILIKRYFSNLNSRSNNL
ncbi:O-antigen translocase [Winogradskyella aurantiaca]|uniref:O-antigen translocase n=1 Tax=Winogradskyella aurantiaca TaxID=2219558 RepID=UPI000E1DAE44|nr:O-antigen translocase [Winogradskyella aurantiaca]